LVSVEGIPLESCVIKRTRRKKFDAILVLRTNSLYTDAFSIQNDSTWILVGGKLTVSVREKEGKFTAAVLACNGDFK
jgi:hypothetical protein